MEHRRSFLGLLLLAWPFGRAARAEAQTSAKVARPSSSELVEQALADSLAKVEDAVREYDKALTFEEQALNKLRESCRYDFEECLKEPGAEGRWSAVKHLVFRNAALIGRYACAVREVRGDVTRKVIYRYDVKGGLEFVSKHCNVECDSQGRGKPRIQRAYCANAVKNWGHESRPADE